MWNDADDDSGIRRSTGDPRRLLHRTEMESRRLLFPSCCYQLPANGHCSLMHWKPATCNIIQGRSHPDGHELCSKHLSAWRLRVECCYTYVTNQSAVSHNFPIILRKVTYFQITYLALEQVVQEILSCDLKSWCLLTRARNHLLFFLNPLSSVVHHTPVERTD